MRLRARRAGKHDPQRAASVSGLRSGESSKLRSIDPLTGLLDRREAVREIEALLTSGSVTIARFDVNGFNRLTHDLGHTAADMVLSRLALVLAQHAAPTDVLGRIGGDDFVLARLCAETDAIDQLSEKVVKSLSTHLTVDLLRSGQSEPAAQVEVVLSVATTVVESHPHLAKSLSKLDDQVTEQNTTISASSVLTLDENAHQRLSSLPSDLRLGKS